jgi:hypothetical protein
MLSESEESMRKMKAVIEKLESDNAGLINQLEEERRYKLHILYADMKCLITGNRSVL